MEKGWQWAEQHQMFQEVLVSRTDAGSTFRVHRALADQIGTTIIYTVSGPAASDWSDHGRGTVDLPPGRL